MELGFRQESRDNEASSFKLDITLLMTCPFAVLFVCVYFPTDHSNVTSHTAFAECISELDGIISAENFDNIIIAGDFNTDLSVLIPISPLSLHP